LCNTLFGCGFGCHETSPPMNHAQLNMVTHKFQWVLPEAVLISRGKDLKVYAFAGDFCSIRRRKEYCPGRPTRRWSRPVINPAALRQAVRRTMKHPPKTIDGARLVRWSAIDDRHRA